MANETTTTTLATLIPDVMEMNAIETAESQKVFRPVVCQPGVTLFDFTGLGSNLDVQQAGTVSFAAIGDGDFATNQAFTTTERSLSPVYLGGTLTIAHNAQHRSAINPQDLIADAVATAWVALEDSNTTYGFACFHDDADTSGPDNTIGTDATPMNAAIIRQGVQLLMTSKAPRPYNFFIDPLQWSELLTDTVARDLLKDNGTQPAGFGATEGVRYNMGNYVGKLFGCDIWCVPTGMEEDSGLHAMMTGHKALGLAYERIATPLSPTPSELNIEVDWDAVKRAYTVNFTVSFQIGGLPWTANNNKWLINIIS